MRNFGEVEGGGLLTSSALLQLLGYPLHIFHFVQIRCDVVRFALAECIELLACLFTCFCVARRYKDVGAVLYEAFADHAADAFGTAGDEDDLALQGVLVEKLEEVWRH